MTTYSTPTSNLSVCFVFYFPPFWSNAVDVGNNIYSWKAFSDKLHGVKKKLEWRRAQYILVDYELIMTLLQSWLYLQYGVAHNIWQKILPNRKLI